MRTAAELTEIIAADRRNERLATLASGIDYAVEHGWWTRGTDTTPGTWTEHGALEALMGSMSAGAPGGLTRLREHMDRITRAFIGSDRGELTRFLVAAEHYTPSPVTDPAEVEAAHTELLTMVTGWIDHALDLKLWKVGTCPYLNPGDWRGGQRGFTKVYMAGLNEDRTVMDLSNFFGLATSADASTTGVVKQTLYYAGLAATELRAQRRGTRRPRKTAATR